MPVEAYALVVMKRGVKVIDSINPDSPYEFRYARDDEISFCHIRLIDSRGKLPRWEVDKNFFSFDSQTTGNRKDINYCAQLAHLKAPPNQLLIGVIDDRRITLTQIRQLFPECATMPFKIALDYVRDRII